MECDRSCSGPFVPQVSPCREKPFKFFHLQYMDVGGRRLTWSNFFNSTWKKKKNSHGPKAQEMSVETTVETACAQ